MLSPYATKPSGREAVIHVMPGTFSPVHNAMIRLSKPEYQLLIGNTPVLSMIQPEEKQMEYARNLENRGEQLEIVHAPGFINFDCGCGYNLPITALACLRLEDLKAFYV